MTVGEKIQYYRKKIGLSQEELGQKMLVSRQTISLWEMDKTMPTVDNLLRLKEIFSVSVDDILSEAEPAEAVEAAPRESYVFKYESADLKKFYKRARFPLIKGATILTIVCVAVILFFEFWGPDSVGSFFMLGYWVACMVYYMRNFAAFKKSWKVSERGLLQSTYCYDVFDKYFVLTVSRNSEVRKTLTIDFKEVEKSYSAGDLLIMQIGGQLYVLKMDALPSDSVFFPLCRVAPGEVRAKRAPSPRNILSIVLFVLSICTIWGAMICVGVLSVINHATTDYMWVFFLFLPIPIASIVFGFCLKYKKNVIVGFIMAALLSIYGSFTFIFSNIYSHSDEPILKAEQMLNIDIPEHSRINTQDWTKGSQAVSRGYIYSTSDIFFDDTAVENFEKNLSSDAKWMSSIPSDMIGITSYFCDGQTSDYYIVYNKDTGEFNKLPSSSGTYVFINILYNAESNTMKLVEYQIEYTK